MSLRSLLDCYYPDRFKRSWDHGIGLTGHRRRQDDGLSVVNAKQANNIWNTSEIRLYSSQQHILCNA